eukprot:2336886-Rhodomonas_salina.1
MRTPCELAMIGAESATPAPQPWILTHGGAEGSDLKRLRYLVCTPLIPRYPGYPVRRTYNPAKSNTRNHQLRTNRTFELDAWNFPKLTLLSSPQPKLRNQIQVVTFSAQSVLGMWVLVFDSAAAGFFESTGGSVGGEGRLSRPVGPVAATGPGTGH